MMPKGEWGSKRFQDHNSKRNPTGNLKNRLADNRVSIVEFWYKYVKRHSHATYDEFLECLNVQRKFTQNLQKAVDEFLEKQPCFVFDLQPLYDIELGALSKASLGPYKKYMNKKWQKMTDVW